jgi:hypothetical protein
VIAKFVEVILAEYLGLKSALGKPITSLVATLKRIPEPLFLLWSWLQFEVGYKFHVVKYREVY